MSDSVGEKATADEAKDNTNAVDSFMIVMSGKLYYE
jgi:hypothetical protein